MNDVEMILLKLREDLNLRRYQESTILRYEAVVENFLNYKNNKYLYDLDEYDVVDYLHYLTIERNYKASSYNNINSILKFFLEVTLEKNIRKTRLPSAKVEYRVKKIPTKLQTLNIIDSIENLKYKIWLELMFGSGLRCDEISKLKVCDIDSKNMKINVIGKGNKERITVLPRRTLEDLRKYCIAEHITSKCMNNYLFKGRVNGHISTSTISQIISELADNIYPTSNFTAHSFRRSFATNCHNMGVDIKVLQEEMGHNSYSTTARYIQAVYLNKKLSNPLD